MQPPDVNKAEQKLIEAKGFRNFLEPPDEKGIFWIRRKKDGACFFHANNKCAIYEVRPAVCRLEPFTIVDYDFEKNRIELELNFPFTSCCIGVNEETASVPVEEIGEAAQVLMQKILALTAKDLNLPVADKRVYSETRSRLLRRRVEMANLLF
jgi:Fe-S-cluster containining protein